MLNELLGIEKKDNDTSGFRNTDLAAFVVQCIEQLKGIFLSKDIGLETCLTSEDFFARIDPLHLQRVIHNLLSNAVKFSPQGGRIEVSSEIKSNRFRLAIKDHGIGIPFEMQALVFDRFTTAQRQGTSGEASTGLGLYFARQTVDLHGGRIWFESEVGQGTTFFIELPRY
jgi:signal transduction histidine kinase